MAQIYLELSDYANLGKAVMEIVHRPQQATVAL